MKALWALEPKSQNAKSISGMANIIEQFTKGPQEVDLCYVVTGNESYLNTAFDIPVEDRFSSYPQKLILAVLKSSGVKVAPEKISVLLHRTFSTTTAVDQLLKFAKSKKTKLLALFTHNKKGFERLLMGSFAETAVHRSPIDILIAGPKSKYPKKIRSILYASDFSTHSLKEASRVIDLCKQMGCKITIFHSAQPIYRWSLDESNPKIQAYRRKIDLITDRLERECRKKGVSCKIMIYSDLDPISDLVFKVARITKADLIALSAKTGRFAALIGGSVTRNILRQGTYPVWVLKG